METKIKPVINIAGTDFYATAFSMELVEVANEQNRISVYEMLSLDDHLEFLFDKENKSVYEGRWDSPRDDERLEYVWIRPIEALDPEGARQVFQLSKLAATPDYFDLLPVVKIADAAFMVDDTVKGFRQQSNPWNIIRFADVMDGEHPFVYYDRKVNNTPFPHELDVYDPPAILPEHIIKADVPAGAEIASLIQKSQVAIRAHEQMKNQNSSRRRGKGL